VSPQHPRIYSDALIRCVVSGQPPPDVSWRFNGRRLTLGLLLPPCHTCSTQHTHTLVQAPGTKASPLQRGNDGLYSFRRSFLSLLAR